MKCGSCGLDNDPDLLHCDNCEYPLGGSAPAAAVPRPATAPYARRPVTLPLARPLTVGGLALLSVVTAGSVAWAMTRDDTAATAAAPPPAGTTTTAATTGPAPVRPDSVTAPSDDLIAQAEALDKVLDSSEQSRSRLNNGIQQARSCSTIDAGLSDLRTAGAEREQQRADLAGLDLSALPGGDRLRAELDSALSHSLDADRNYVRWAAERAATPCGDSASSDTHYAAADADSTEAGQAKLRFLGWWNPVALTTGLPQRDRQGL